MKGANIELFFNKIQTASKMSWWTFAGYAVEREERRD